MTKSKTQPNKLFLETFVAGLIYSDYQTIPLKREDKLNLIHESDNAFDSKAIRVEKNGVKLGYIPRGLTYLIHDNVDNVIDCRVKSYHQGNPSHRALYIQIFEKPIKQLKGKIC